MMDFAAKKNEQPQRLKALQARLREIGVDYFFVPISDEYMNEYVPDHAQRLAWLTGFTGSAGLALVGLDKAALFTDGRYTIQAAREVDGALYSLCHITKMPLVDYIKKEIGKGARMAYDPWLHTKAWLDRTRKVAEEAGATLAPVQENPIDKLWVSRPPAPKAPVFAHPLAIAGEDSVTKRARLGADLKIAGADAAVMTSPPSIAWLLNVRGGDVPHTPLPLSYAWLWQNGVVEWFVDQEKINNTLRAALDAGITIYPQEEFLSALQRAKGKTIRFDAQHAPVKVFETLVTAGALIQEGLDPCELPKAIKNKAEIAGMVDAHEKDGLALTRFLCWLDQHALACDEISAQETLLTFRKQQQTFRGPSFPSISGAGPNGAVVHYHATPETCRKLRAGELYLIDSGGQYGNGTTDVTRTVAIGTPPAQARQHFTLVLKGHIALARARFPEGITGSQLDVLARSALWHEGLDYDHGTGHGVGAYLGVHEGPQGISLRASTPLKAGMIISNEPGFYKEGAYGIRIESLVVVKESALQLDGKPMLEFETLTLAPIDKGLVEVGLLDAQERAWLNSYHARVYACHAPFMNADEKTWLQAATAPLKSG